MDKIEKEFRPHYDEDQDEGTPTEVKALKHAFYNLLNFPIDSHYWVGLESCEVTDIDDLIMLDPLTDLQDIRYSYTREGPDKNIQ